MAESDVRTRNCIIIALWRILRATVKCLLTFPYSVGEKKFLQTVLLSFFSFLSFYFLSVLQNDSHSKYI